MLNARRCCKTAAVLGSRDHHLEFLIQSFFYWIFTPSASSRSIVGADVSSDDEEVQEGNEAEGVSKEEPVGAAEGTGVDQGDTELPSELRMDEYDDEPTLTMVGNPSGNADIDAENAMDEDRPEVEAGEDEEDEDVAVNLVEEPSTGQVRTPSHTTITTIECVTWRAQY